jgi:hypothetical protein
VERNITLLCLVRSGAYQFEIDGDDPTITSSSDIKYLDEAAAETLLFIEIIWV